MLWTLLGDHSFEEEALGTNTALRWDRPGTSVNMGSARLWILGGKNPSFPLFCSHSSLACKEDQSVSRGGHLSGCAFKLVVSSSLGHSERPAFKHHFPPHGSKLTWNLRFPNWTRGRVGTPFLAPSGVS